MKLFTSFRWALGAVLVVAAAGVFAQDGTRVAHVNIQRLTTEPQIAKAAQTKLEQEFSKTQKDLADLQARVKSLTEKYEREALTMSESQRQTKQKEISDLTRDLQRGQRQFQEDLNVRRNDELQQILEKANKAVKQVADTEKYDIVLQDVAYSNLKHDITDKVIKIMDAAPAK